MASRMTSINLLVQRFIPSQLQRTFQRCQPRKPYQCRLNATRGVTTTSSLTTQEQNSHQRKGKSIRAIQPQVAMKLRESVFLNERYKNTISTDVYSSKQVEKIHWQETLDKKACEQFSMLEIRNMLENMVALHKSPILSLMGNVDSNVMRQALQNIELECVINRMSECDVNKLLIIADLFFCCQYEASKFYLSLMDYFLRNKARLALKPTHVVQVLFYAGNTRRCRPEHMNFIEDFLVESVRELTGKELALICFSFFINNAKITNRQFLREMADTVVRDFEAEQLDNQQLINVMKAFRHAGFNSLPFFQQIGDLLCNFDHNHQSNPNPTQLATIFHTYSSLKISHPKLFEFCLLEFEKRRQTSKGRVRAKDLARVLGSCAILNVQIPEFIVQDVIGELSNADQQRQFPTLLLEALHHLAILGKYPFHLFDTALSEKMVKRITAGSDIHHNRLLLLDTCIQIECPDYTGNTLDKDFLNMLPQRAKGDIEHQFVLRTGLGALYLALKELWGKQRVKCHFILPFSNTPDIEFRFGSDGNPEKLGENDQSSISSSQFLRELKANMDGTENKDSLSRQSVLQKLLHEKEQTTSSPTRKGVIPDVTYRNSTTDSAEKRVSIRVTSDNQYLGNEPRLTGHHEMENRLLNKLGYDVILISPEKAAELQRMSFQDLLEFTQHLTCPT